MTTLNRPLKRIVVLGATGNIGRPIVERLLEHPAGYVVTAVTRSNDGRTSFPAAVEVVTSDFSDKSLANIFNGKDVVVASIPVPQVAMQRRLIDLAIASGVARFVPSEFGMDTVKPEAVQWRPKLIEKVKILEYLKTKESQLEWTAFMTGGFLDWALQSPGGFGFNFAKRTVTLYDGGEVQWEATNLARVGDAIAAALAPSHQRITANQIAYINSFTITQKEILAVAEKLTGQKFDVTFDSTRAFRDRAAERLQKDPADRSAALDMATASIMGLGGINQYSKEREIWNEKLGLKQEDLEGTVKPLI